MRLENEVWASLTESLGRDPTEDEMTEEVFRREVEATEKFIELNEAESTGN